MSKTPRITAYKVVRWDGGVMRSLYDQKVIYTLMKRMSNPARPNHKGGFYAYSRYADAADILLLNNVNTLTRGYLCYTAALIEVQLAGKIIHYDSGKLAATYLTPTTILGVYGLTHRGVYTSPWADNPAADYMWWPVDREVWEGQLVHPEIEYTP